MQRAAPKQVQVSARFLFSPNRNSACSWRSLVWRQGTGPMHVVEEPGFQQRPRLAPTQPEHGSEPRSGQASKATIISRNQNIESYWAQSPLFFYGPLPENNVPQWSGYDAPAGAVSASVADGFYLMLKPLNLGQHHPLQGNLGSLQLHFGHHLPSDGAIGGQGSVNCKGPSFWVQ
jgi:hypothetical protein